jgi:hypothetical protein
MVNQFFMHNNQIKVSVVESKDLTQLTQNLATEHYPETVESDLHYKAGISLPLPYVKEQMCCCKHPLLQPVHIQGKKFCCSSSSLPYTREISGNRWNTAAPSPTVSVHINISRHFDIGSVQFSVKLK